MKLPRSIAPLAAAALLAAAFACAAEEETTMLRPGDPAPPFALAGSDGSTHSLADYAGKQAVVIAWFPKAFTSG